MGASRAASAQREANRIARESFEFSKQQAEDARTAGMEQAKKADQYAQESSQQPEQQPEQQIEQQPSGLNLNRFWEQPQQPQQPQQAQESQPQTQPTLNLNRFWENK